MAKLLVIGAGGVGAVAVHKMALCETMQAEITLASRHVAKCDAIAENLHRRTGKTITTAQLDADDSDATARLIEKTGASLVVNLALPYQDLSIMEACLKAGADYLDTANYEPRDVAKFEYHWQWDYHKRFQKAGLMALLGSGFDPGVTNVFTAYTNKHLIETIETLDIVDCNGGAHGRAFATNFNPEINIREVTAPARHYADGDWLETPPPLHRLSQRAMFDFPQIGQRDIYLMYHEELESLVRYFPSLTRARFWMSFSESYINHLQVLQNVGMTAIEPIIYAGQEIIPLQFLKAVLPEPASLAASTKGKTCIGTIISGTNAGKSRTIFLYNICDHAACFAELGSQAVSYTTGVPAMIGASLMVDKTWHKAGVWNMEQFDPDPFMERLTQYGLGWQHVELPAPIEF